MTVKIFYKNRTSTKNSINNVLFADEKFNLKSLKKHLTKIEHSLITDLIKAKDLKKKIIDFDLSSKKKIILVSIKNNLKASEAENLGASFFDKFKELKQSQVIINSDTASNKQANLIGHFLHGLKLKSYAFEKYKTNYNCDW